MPLVRPDGFLVALKGASAADEIERDGAAIRKAGGADAMIVECGVAVLEVPSTVVKIRRQSSKTAQARSRKR